MPDARPFRFAVQGRTAATGNEWLTKARRAEDLGYDIFVMPDHFVRGLEPIAALAAAAVATTAIRLGSFVIANDYRHPVILAQETATIDLLSKGRFELGLGAGWLRAEYEAAGLAFDPPAVRVARLDEAVRLIKRLWTEDAVTVDGAHYAVSDLTVSPKPVQRPRPPIMIAGGGRRAAGAGGRRAGSGHRRARAPLPR